MKKMLGVSLVIVLGLILPLSQQSSASFISEGWFLQSKDLPITVSNVSPSYDEEDIDTDNPQSDSNLCITDKRIGVFAYEYSEENLGVNCQVEVYFPDETSGHWHLQVYVEPGEWIDAWTSNLFGCGNAGDLGLAACGKGKGNNILVPKTDAKSVAISTRGREIFSTEIKGKDIWTVNFEIPTKTSKSFCAVFEGQIDYRIKATLKSKKIIYSPPFTVIYSGDLNWRKYGTGASACDDGVDLDSKGVPYQLENLLFGEIVPTSAMQNDWSAYSVESPNSESSTDSLIAVDYSQGYDRNLFKHWIDADKNGCNTRAEVLIAEAVVKPKIGKNCALTGGKWLSAYDGKLVTDASKLDVDYLVPLAEAWRSGAWAWTSKQRQDYANDLTDSRALIAVTSNSNRSKSDKDLRNWLPTVGKCGYIKDWVAIKKRYSLTYDNLEMGVVRKYSESCKLTTIKVMALSGFRYQSSNSASAEASKSETSKTSISPGAFCAPAGATGVNSSGVKYTCKTSETDTRNRWRQ